MRTVRDERSDETQPETIEPDALAQNLHLLCSRLAELGPDDVQELADLADDAYRLRDQAEVRAIAKMIGRAASKVEAVIEGRATHPESALDGALRLLQAAEPPRHPARVPKTEESEGEERPAASNLTSEAASINSAVASAEETWGHEDPELLLEFREESQDNLQDAEAALLTLEEQPDDSVAINRAFRAFHTIKGVSAFLEFEEIVQLAHSAETLLSRARDAEILCTGHYAELALRSIDLLRKMIAATQDSDRHGTPDGFTELLEDLHQAADARNDAKTRHPSSPRSSAGPDVERGGPDQPHKTPSAAPRKTASRPHSTNGGVDSFVRVRTDRLDRLVEAVGELVIAQAMVTQDGAVGKQSSAPLHRKVSHAAKIARDLQQLSLALRMVPLRATFQRMSRVVRDVARKSGKEIEFVTHGEETELDRTLVGILADLLIHMLRNAADHGIEPPAERKAAGKPGKGKIELAAYSREGHVVVEIRDDGRGLDREKILNKALEKGLLEGDVDLSDEEIYSQIFSPGFSTQNQITDVSGRGVGMDVVKKGIDQLKGQISIESEFGKGTVFSLGLPLTLAITDGMLVRVGDQRYVLPTVNIVVTLNPTKDKLYTVSGRGEMVKWLGETIPVFRIHHLFGVPRAIEDVTRGLLVVTSDAKGKFALLVDELLGQQQVVTKSLGWLGTVPGVSGGAILGDGQVGLILDPGGLGILARTPDHQGRGTMQKAMSAAMEA